jgi:hypothetical protein
LPSVGMKCLSPRIFAFLASIPPRLFGNTVWTIGYVMTFFPGIGMVSNLEYSKKFAWAKYLKAWLGSSSLSFKFCLRFQLRHLASISSPPSPQWCRPELHMARSSQQHACTGALSF